MGVMLSDFEPLLRRYGAWLYRRMFWEAGMIGQAVHLAVEDAGFHGVGMGSFFVSWTEEVLGVDGRQLRDVCHFALGLRKEPIPGKSLEPHSHLEHYRELFPTSEDRDKLDTAYNRLGHSGETDFLDTALRGYRYGW